MYDPEEHPHHTPTQMSQKRSKRKRFHPNQFSSLERFARQKLPSWTLRFHSLQAVDVLAGDVSGTSDPYVFFQVGAGLS